jgi:hypothetical protein
MAATSRVVSCAPSNRSRFATASIAKPLVGALTAQISNEIIVRHSCDVIHELCGESNMRDNFFNASLPDALARALTKYNPKAAIAWSVCKAISGLCKDSVNNAKMFGDLKVCSLLIQGRCGTTYSMSAICLNRTTGVIFLAAVYDSFFCSILCVC